MDFQSYLDIALPHVNLTEDDEREPLLSAVGKRLKEYRLKNHLTQADIAGKSGISQGYLSKLENGKYNICIRQLERVASAMGARITIEVMPYEK